MRTRWILFAAAAMLGGCSSKEESQGSAQPPADDGDHDSADPADTGDSGQTVGQVLYVDDIGDDAVGEGTEDDPYRSLQDAVQAAGTGDTLILAEGTHVVSPSESVDETCGNCDDASFRQDIEITVGVHIEDKALVIEGESRENTVIDTGAGYGLYFENAGESVVRNLTITGGIRDADGQATDAAIVVKYTSLLVEDVDVLENNDLYDGKPDPVVGVMGITGREGADLTVVGSRILDSSWDGVTLYRSDPDVDGSAPHARIVNNTIGCTRQCIFYQNGRGVGIGVTWDATAEIVNNHLYEFWKGIGSFGTSQVTVTNNVVEEMYGWGIIASGYSTMNAENNVVFNSGNTGMAAWDSTASGRFANNVVTGSGWVDEWVGKNTGLWINSDSFTFAYNDVWGNADEEVCSGGYPGGSACTAVDFDGVDGNVSVDPLFEDENDFVLSSDSPLIDAGDPSVLDVDGSVSDMGVHGGPDAGRTDP